MVIDWGRRLALTSPGSAIRPIATVSASAMLVLMIAACHAAQPAQPRSFADPAVAEALFEPLMTDVELRGAAGPDALLPGEQPSVMQVPADAIVDTSGATTLAQVAALRVRDAAFAGCNAAVGYSAQWSVRLPLWLELPVGARLAEAVGSEVKGCALRIIRFGVKGTVAVALDGFAVIAKRGEFGVERGAGTLIARRKGDRAAFRVDVIANSAGTRIDLTSNRGR